MLRTILFLSLITALGCGDSNGEGTLAVSAYGESFIEDGIPSDEMDDGWAIAFDSFMVTLNADIGGENFAGTNLVLHESTAGAGAPLGSAVLPSGTYDDVTFQIDALNVMGSATKDGRTITFDWTFDTPQRYVSCEESAVVPEDGIGNFEITIHGDHLFFDSLVSDEPGLLFEPLAAADTNADDVLTRAELEAADVGTYDVGNSDVTNLWQYLVAQSLLIGHVNGEGHCDS
ncbi:MAG: hypothetical protein AAF938_24265 [Myxococcota bacterium]